jgi:hypothetical protein
VSNRTLHLKRRASEVPGPDNPAIVVQCAGRLAHAGNGLEERKLPMKFSWVACQPHWGSLCMTEYLIAVRAAIILRTNLAVMPTEILFDAIEAELERRDVEVKPRRTLSFISGQRSNFRSPQ